MSVSYGQLGELEEEPLEPEPVEGQEQEQEGREQERDREQYEIEAIVKYKADVFKDPPDAGYEVKWKGYDERENSWIRPADALELNAWDLVEAWWEQAGTENPRTEPSFEIEAIVRYKADTFKDPPDAGYKVKWKGYDERDNSWIRPADALELNAWGLVEAWWEQAGMKNPHAHLIAPEDSQPFSGVAAPTLDVCQIHAANKTFLAIHPQLSPRVLYGRRLRAAVEALQDFVRLDSQPDAETRLYHYSQLLQIEMGLYEGSWTTESLLNNHQYHDMKTRLIQASNNANLGKGTAAIKEVIVNLPLSSDVPKEAQPLLGSPLGDLCWWTMLDVNRQVTRSMILAVEIARNDVTYISAAKLREWEGRVLGAR